MINQTECPRQNEGYMLEELDGELLLYHLDQTKTVYLNNSAAIVWHLCNGENSVGDIIAFLEEKYPEAVKEIAGDVQDTLLKLLDAGALSLG
ncbi:MAG TPA: PqqD family protein [Desulfobulbaceae bacterium]|nr:PqqD family protein [Desulfobulbaceae bacterium]